MKKVVIIFLFLAVQSLQGSHSAKGKVGISGKRALLIKRLATLGKKKFGDVDAFCSTTSYKDLREAVKLAEKMVQQEQSKQKQQTAATMPAASTAATFIAPQSSIVPAASAVVTVVSEAEEKEADELYRFDQPERDKLAHLMKNPDHMPHAHSRLIMREILGNHPEVVKYLDKTNLNDARFAIACDDTITCPVAKMVVFHDWISNAAQHLKEDPISGMCHGFACRTLLNKYAKYDDGNRICMNCRGYHGFTDKCRCNECLWSNANRWDASCLQENCPEGQIFIDQQVRDGFLRRKSNIERAKRALDGADELAKTLRENEAEMTTGDPVDSIEADCCIMTARAQLEHAQALKAYNNAVKEGREMFPALMKKLAPKKK